MSITAAALRLMAEKGLSALDIAEIAEALDSAPTRSKNAERQKRWRDNKRNDSSVTHDVTDNVTPPLNDIYSKPPEPQIAKAISTPLADTADRIVAAWNSEISGSPLPTARKLTSDRLKHLKARLAEHGEDGILLAIRNMAASDWHSGRSGKWLEGNLGWLLKSPENCQKMVERCATRAEPAAMTAEEREAMMSRTADIYDRMGRENEAQEIRRSIGLPQPSRDRGGPARPIGDPVRGIQQQAAH